MNIAYVRVSTVEQHTDRQIVALQQYDIDRWYTEKISGKDTKRPQLQAMLKEMRKGDTVYITELSRLGRSMVDLRNITELMTNKGVKLVSLKEPIDLTSKTAYGMFTAGIFQLMAEFERALIKERQAEGIAAAKAAGKSWGKEAKYCTDPEQLDAICYAFFNRQLTREEALARFGGSNGAFYARFRAWMKRNGYEYDDRPAKIKKRGRRQKKAKALNEQNKSVNNELNNEGGEQ